MVNYCLVAFINGSIFTFFSSIATYVSKSYDISLTIMSINSFLYMMVFPLSNLLLYTIIFKKLGLKFSIGIGFLLLIVWLVLRLFINISFNYVNLSGLFAGIA